MLLVSARFPYACHQPCTWILSVSNIGHTRNSACIRRHVYVCRIHMFKKSFSRSVAFKMTEEIKIRICFIKDLKSFCCIAKHCLLFHTLLCWAEFLLKKIPFKTDSLKLWRFASKLPMASCIYSLKCCRPNALSPSKGIQWELWFTWHWQSAHHIICNNSVACRSSLCQWTMQPLNLLIGQASNRLQTVQNPKSSSSIFCIVKSLPYNTQWRERSRIHTEGPQPVGSLGIFDPLFCWIPVTQQSPSTPNLWIPWDTFITSK